MAPTKKLAPKKLTIEFCHNSTMNYHWWLKDKKGGTAGGAGGFESMYELLTDPAFLDAIAKKFGEASMPNGLVQMAIDRQKSRMLPFPDDIVSKLAATFPGVPITDARTKFKKPSASKAAAKKTPRKKAAK